MNPLLASSGYERLVANYVYTPLVYLDADARPIAGIATSWQITDAGRVYRFRLDPRATFSDGTPVRAADVLFTVRRVVDPASGAMQVAGSFDGVDLERSRVVDAQTVEIAFRLPLAEQLLHFNDLFILPEHVYGRGRFREDHNDNALGSGPYRVVRRTAGKEIVLERRADYWRERPHIERVIFKVVTEQATAWNALLLGELDETSVTSDRWIRERDRPTAPQRVALQAFYTRNYHVIAWNTRRPLFADAELRRALAHCVPLDSLLKHLFSGTARAVSGPFTADEWAANPDVQPFPYAPAVAARLLAARGWRDSNRDGTLERAGTPLRFDFVIIAGNPATQVLGQMLQAEWKKIGADVQIVVLDGATAIQRVLAGNYDAAYLAWELDADPDPYGMLHSSQMPPAGQNIVAYDNAAVDDLLVRARRELDATRRRALYRQIHAMIAREQPYTWTVQVASKWATSRRLRGVRASGTLGWFSWYPGELAWSLTDTSRTN